MNKYILIAILFLFSCNAEKMAAKKLVKAENTVQNYPESMKKLANIWLSNNVWIIDSMVRIRPGRIDSIPFLVLVPYDSSKGTVNKLIDSLREARRQLNQVDTGATQAELELAFQTGYEHARNELKQFLVPVKQPDTLEITKRDRLQLKSLNERINQLNEDKALLGGQLIEKDKRIASAEKQASDRMWVILGLIVGFVLLVVGYFYVKGKYFGVSKIIKSV